MQTEISRRGHRALMLTSKLGCSLALVAAGLGMAVPTSDAQVVGPSLARVPSSTNPGSTLTQIETAAKNASKATFKLTYSSKGSNGSTSLVTIEQKPPDQLFKSGSGEVVYNGKKTYYCSTGPSPTCIIYSSPGVSPLAGVVSLYSAGTYVAIMQGWGELIAAHIAGVRISFGSASYAGQRSECVTWSYQGSTDKYCVTDKGILAYAGSTGKSGNSSFELTFYSGQVSGSDFNLPRGARIMSTP